jgi:hypothetical protein
MAQILREEGHLIVEGNETREELRDALINLRDHTYTECHMPFGTVTPIELLISDFRVINPGRTKSKYIVNVDISSEGL